MRTNHWFEASKHRLACGRRQKATSLYQLASTLQCGLPKALASLMKYVIVRKLNHMPNPPPPSLSESLLELSLFHAIQSEDLSFIYSIFLPWLRAQGSKKRRSSFVERREGSSITLIFPTWIFEEKLGHDLCWRSFWLIEVFDFLFVCWKSTAAGFFCRFRVLTNWHSLASPSSFNIYRARSVFRSLR